MTVPVVFAIAGVLALFLAVWGGGIKAKEIEIPVSAPHARLIVGVVGLIFIGISIWLSSPRAEEVPQAAPATPTIFLATSTATIEPTQTLTLSPSPEPTVTPTPTVDEEAAELFKLAFQSWTLDTLDAFDSNTHEWTEGELRSGDELDVANVSINGKYYIDIQTGDGAGWWLASNIQTPGRFYFAVDARRTSIQTGCTMSLYWSTTNGDYLFQVYDSTKEYFVETYDRELPEDNRWKRVIPTTTSNAIRPQEMNKLAVINDGTHLWFYINEQFINRAETEYQSNGGDLGFYVSVCQENAQVTFQFDNMELRRPLE
jgi:hypothetical protein